MALEDASKGLPSFRRLPTGTGGKKLANAERIPVVEVDNEVIYVNPAFPKLPFVIKLGQPTNLALFADQSNTKTKWFNWLNKPRTAEGAPTHNRSLILAHAIYKDTEGRLYGTMDEKGSGYVVKGVSRMSVLPIKKGTALQGMLGILERGAAETDASIAEYFISSGIRTYRIVAITKLKELINNGKRYSIDEAKREGIIPNESEPVISIRAFGTRNRIDDISSRPDSFEDARLMVAQELRRDPVGFGKPEYFRWFANTLAENVARMHKAGFVHKFLSSHNLTLDCRIVDLDGVHRGSKYFSPEIMRISMLRTNFELEEYRDDLDEAFKSLSILRRELADPEIPTYLRKDFEDKYLEALEEN